MRTTLLPLLLAMGCPSGGPNQDDSAGDTAAPLDRGPDWIASLAVSDGTGSVYTRNAYGLVPALAALPDGDLVYLVTLQVDYGYDDYPFLLARVAQDGREVRWARLIRVEGFEDAEGHHGVAATDDGSIVISAKINTGNEILPVAIGFSGDGSLRWGQAVPLDRYANGYEVRVSALPGGRAALLWTDSIAVLDAQDGSVAWAADLPRAGFGQWRFEAWDDRIIASADSPATIAVLNLEGELELLQGYTADEHTNYYGAAAWPRDEGYGLLVVRRSANSGDFPIGTILDLDDQGELLATRAVSLQAGDQLWSMIEGEITAHDGTSGAFSGRSFAFENGSANILTKEIALILGDGPDDLRAVTSADGADNAVGLPGGAFALSTTSELGLQRVSGSTHCASELEPRFTDSPLAWSQVPQDGTLTPRSDVLPEPLEILVSEVEVELVPICGP
jgi:hypothetical protein